MVIYMKELNVIFMGTPEFSVPVLESLIVNTNVIAVVTQPDKEVGRHHELTASPVKEVALSRGIKVIQPVKIRNEYEEIINLKPDLIVISDENSSDNTIATAKIVLESSSVPYKLLTSERRLSVSENFEKGMSECSSDYVFLSDQDDYWYEKNLKSL